MRKMAKSLAMAFGMAIGSILLIFFASLTLGIFGLIAKAIHRIFEIPETAASGISLVMMLGLIVLGMRFAPEILYYLKADRYLPSENEKT